MPTVIRSRSVLRRRFAPALNGWASPALKKAVEARGLCPDARVLVIGSVFPGQAQDVVRHKLTPVVWDPWQFDELEAAARAANVRSISIHLEIDTGMSRQGADPESLALFWRASTAIRLCASKV